MDLQANNLTASFLMREDETEGKTEHVISNGECRQNYSSFDIFNVTSTHPFDKKGGIERTGRETMDPAGACY